MEDIGTLRLTYDELGHIVGRLLMGAGVGWGYLGAIYFTDIWGWGSWADASRFGALAKIELLVVFAVAFGATGAHIGRDNVLTARARARRAS